MLNLFDIDVLTGDMGSVYSDLYKDLNGIRPRWAQFETLEAFFTEYQRVSATSL